MSSPSASSHDKDGLQNKTVSLGGAFTATSSLTQSTLSATVYERSECALHRKHKKPRQIKEKDYTHDFINLCCGSNQDTFEALIARYKKLDGNDNANKEQADGMLGTFHILGARERMLREVFGIGSARYNRIASGAPPRTRGGTNVNSVDKIMIASLAEMVATLPTEDKFPCGHKRKTTQCTDPAINTWMDLFECYKGFMKDKDCRIMGYSTFHKHIRAHHPDLCLKRPQEDVCDSCVNLNNGTECVV